MGTTSISVTVEVFARRVSDPTVVVKVTEAVVVYVTVDERGLKIPHGATAEVWNEKYRILSDPPLRPGVGCGMR